MATLQKIRNNAGLLVSVVIGLALLAFIAGDLLKSGNTMFASSQNEVAEIDGTSVPIQLYQSRIDETVESYKRNTGQSSVDQLTLSRLQDQTWDQLVREYLMTEEYAEVGVDVSGDELFDMVYGNNIDPQIKQIPIFQNQETGQFDRSLVVQFLKNKDLDPTGNTQASWTAFEEALVQEKINQKYNELIRKGLYVTAIEATHETYSKSRMVDFDYTMVRYNTVADSAISYNNDDLKAYYNANKDDFDQKESREVNYLTFPIVPSETDINETEKYLGELKAEFETIENDAQYVNLNSDVPFQDVYLTQDELPLAVVELFNAEEGTVYGPYRDGESFKLSKVSKFAYVPDSVKARHILLQPQTQEEYVSKRATADSLLQLIEKGGNFAQLAKTYSVDGSAQAGGDLGWFTEGAMVKPFSDACFFGKKGDVTIVESQFGIHVIEITNQAKATKKVQLATIEHTIEPSSATYQAIYSQANQFGGQNRTLDAFRTAADEKGMSLRVATLAKNDKQVANIENSRSMIRWAYQAKEGDVSNEVFDFDNVFVIAVVKKVNEEGIAPFADVKAEIEREVKIEKKAAYLLAQAEKAKEGAGTLLQVAENLNADLKEVKGATFGAYAVPGLGYEPEVQAYATTLEKEIISAPIKGKNGVFVLTVKNIIEPSTEASINAERVQLLRGYQSRVSYQVYSAIMEASEIVDNRATFY